ncbi:MULTISPECIES: hypothetical protein [unclassified Microcoleus]|uniref:hypothetical protein n=1 Tax=unclassified Microcoleus TaxID=2642155 RepID=UPI002FD37E09
MRQGLKTPVGQSGSGKSRTIELLSGSGKSRTIELLSGSGKSRTIELLLEYGKSRIVKISDCRCATVGSCVNIKLEQCAIARNAFQGHSLPILDLSVTFTEKQESLNDPN